MFSECSLWRSHLHFIAMSKLFQPSWLSVRNMPTTMLIGLVFNKPISLVCQRASVRLIHYVTNEGRTAAISKKFNVAVTPGCYRLSHTERAVTPDCHNHKDEDNVLIYHGALTPQIRMVKMFSLCSSVAGLAAQPMLYKHASELGGTGVVIAVVTFVGFFTFVTPFLLHLLTRKYVTDIHHNSSTGVYAATLLTFFLRKKTVLFKSEEVEVPDVPGLFTSFKVKKRALFVDPRAFEDPNHYGKLMGYDKPMDFILGKGEMKSDSKKKSKESTL